MVESESIVKSPKKNLTKKRKMRMASPVETKSLKLEEAPKLAFPKHSAGPQKTEGPPVALEGMMVDVIGERYPVLKDEKLVQRFLNVPMTNNQKGRLRQLYRENLKGTADFILPDVIHNRIQNVLKSSVDLTDTDLRKIRILYNMLNTAIKAEHTAKNKKSGEKKNKEKKKIHKEPTNDNEVVKKPKTTEVNKEQMEKKEKGKKRYVVFIGNLPKSVNKDMIMSHFSELNEHIVNIRIPPLKEEKRSAIAYVELANEPTYELALSKHHSMLGNKRINVLYTTQKNSKVSKTDAKSKSAKLVALQKSGKLIGSTPLAKKRSQRRAKMKRARAAAENA